MTHIYWMTLITITLYKFFVGQAVELYSIALLLLCLTTVAWYQRFYRTLPGLIIIGITILIISGVEEGLIYLMGIVPYFAFRDSNYYEFKGEQKIHRLWFHMIGILFLIAGIIVHWVDISEERFAILILGPFLGYMFNHYCYREKEYIESIDEERRLRYENEHIKNQLIHATEEVEILSETKERNRIARDIHDHVGHGIAGVLFLLQASRKTADKDIDKSMELLDESVNKLTETLELTRQTVHNLEAPLRTGIQVIQKIIDDYQYCQIDFVYTGDFNQISSALLTLSRQTTKELLTNTSKYSGANHVDIKMDINDYFLRYQFKDNGVGAEPLQLGMGLRSIKDRVINRGGTFVVNGSEGFEVILNIPLT